MSEDDPQQASDGLDDEPSRNVITYFRDHPARFFGTLGSFAFILGWAGVIYLAFFSEYATGPGAPSDYRIQLMVSLGASVTIASAILWGIAAYVWIHLLPEIPSNT